jgi:hypothetical protein
MVLYNFAHPPACRLHLPRPPAETKTALPESLASALLAYDNPMALLTWDGQGVAPLACKSLTGATVSRTDLND